MYVPIWVPPTTSCSLHIWCDAYHFHSTSPERVHINPQSFGPHCNSNSESNHSNLLNLHVWKACITSILVTRFSFHMLQDSHLRRNQTTCRITLPGEPSDALLITLTLSANPCKSLFLVLRIDNCHVQCSIIRKRCNGYCQKQLGWKIECSRKQKDVHTLCTDTNVDKHKHTTCILQYGCWTPMGMSWGFGRWLRCSCLSWSGLSIGYLFHTGTKWHKATGKGQ